MVKATIDSLDGNSCGPPPVLDRRRTKDNEVWTCPTFQATPACELETKALELSNGDHQARWPSPAWRTVRQAGEGQRAWWSPFDNSSAFVSSSQAGVAWNVGQVQTSLSFVRRRSKTGGGPQLFPSNESIVAFTIRLKPRG